MPPRNRSRPLCPDPAHSLTDRELVKILCGFIGSFSCSANYVPGGPAGPRFATASNMKNALLWIGDHIVEILTPWQVPHHEDQRGEFGVYLGLVDELLSHASALEEGDLSAGACWEALAGEISGAARARQQLRDGAALDEK